MNAYPLYQHIAKALQWRSNVSGAYLDRAEELIDALETQLPSGSGIDTGTKIDREKSTPEKLVLTFGYHHMNHNGYYTHWTDHKVTIKPSLVDGFDMKITKNGTDDYLMDYLHDVFCAALRDLYRVDYDADNEQYKATLAS
jgi:hypothetical protein